MSGYILACSFDTNLNYETTMDPTAVFHEPLSKVPHHVPLNTHENDFSFFCCC